MICIIIYIYLYLYLCIYTPSYPHFKAFPVSKFNSETSFLYQLFKENSNFIVLKPCKVIYFSIFYYFHSYLCIYLGMLAVPRGTIRTPGARSVPREIGGGRGLRVRGAFLARWKCLCQHSSQLKLQGLRFSIYFFACDINYYFLILNGC